MAVFPSMHSSSEAPRVAIIGAGITGLTAAWQARQSGLAPVVFEQSGRVGGVIGAMRCDDWLHELGPNSLLENSREVTGLIEALGLGSRRLYAAPEAKQRYVVRGGRPVAMPASPLGFLSTNLFSWRAKLALLGEPWRPRFAGPADESVADFVLRRLGREFLDYAINPFVGGVYAGDPAKLSVRHAFPKLYALEQEHGSLIRGALARRNTSGGPSGRIFSFPQGLGELPVALAQTLRPALHLHTTVKTLRRTADGWEIDYAKGGLDRTDRFAAVICALPAEALATLDIEGAPRIPRLESLRQIEQAPVVSVFTGFRRADVRHPLDGFGLLMPAVERGLILGTLFSSTLFPGRAPDGYVALTSFVGGVRDPELARVDDDAIVHLVQSELTRLLGVRQPAVFTHVQRCPRAIPQYTLGFQRHENAIAAVEAVAPHLFIGGNCRDGISLTHCIASGTRLAHAARASLRAAPNPISISAG
jgi:oxygen-dependent protoporphyrinogen oxidase